MRQTSLLDSFIKKQPKNSQNSYNSQKQSIIINKNNSKHGQSSQLLQFSQKKTQLMKSQKKQQNYNRNKNTHNNHTNNKDKIRLLEQLMDQQSQQIKNQKMDIEQYKIINLNKSNNNKQNNLLNLNKILITPLKKQSINNQNMNINQTQMEIQKYQQQSSQSIKLNNNRIRKSAQIIKTNKFQQKQIIKINHNHNPNKSNIKSKLKNITRVNTQNNNNKKKYLQSDDDFNQQINSQPQNSNQQSYDQQLSSQQQSFDQESFSNHKSKNIKQTKSILKKNIVKKRNIPATIKNKQTKVDIKQINYNKENQINRQFCSDIAVFDRSKFTDTTPEWAIPGTIKCKDKYGNTYKDQNYDQTTLKVPDQTWDQLTGPMKQYWSIKSQNFDKIIFFKLGKFYQLFYQDALICNQLLNLKWMGTKMHVGFPEKSLDRYTQELVKNGLKVVVVQQMQTPDQMNNRIAQDKKYGRKSQKTIRRQVTQIITKGTLQKNQNQEEYLPNYLLTLYRHEELIAYSLLEISSNLILLGIVQGFQQFKTILYQTYPSQILYNPDNLPKEYVDIMKQNIEGLVLTKLINQSNVWHYLNATNQLKQLESKGFKHQQIFSELQNWNIQHRNLLMSTLSGLFQYLHKIFKFQYVLSTAKFKFYQKEKALSHMILDSQALQHLQIFQTIIGHQDSLFSKIDRTKTKFGKRLFRRWMTSPLLSQYLINQRLDSVEDLKQLGNQIQKIQRTLGKLPDLQKMANRLYKYSITNTSAASAVYFQDLNTNRLKQFDSFMKSLEQSLLIFSILQNHIHQFKSQRLKRLIIKNQNYEQLNKQKLIYYQDQEYDDQNINNINNNNNNKATIKGMLPDILSQLQTFKKYIIWKQCKPLPKYGVIEMYDQLVDKQNQIKRQLSYILQKIRKQLNCAQINYVHIKQRYQVQIPQKKNLKIPKQYSFSSKKVGYSRYLVSQVQQIVEKLQIIEKGLKTQMNIFVTFFFQQFKSKQNIWEKYISILAQIDCFIGIAQYSNQKKTSRPRFVKEGYEVIEGVHPALYSIDFVPNDISFKDRLILLTGPNMGGKSTILRTSCLLSIMAQMGCYVPCKSYKASIIDRIFTRIGASDKLQAGKSTFFIQMQQTKSIVKSATYNSLAIIDQLGRGTATYDGMALAHSVLNYLIKNINCKCMFATHYHSLTEQFASTSGTALKMMDYQIIKQKQDRIQFLYKLVNGKAEKSFGLNVAQLVGLPKNLIGYAKLKSHQMHQQIQKKKKKVKIQQIINQIMNK